MPRALATLFLLSLSTSSLAQSVFFGNLHAHTSYSDGVKTGTPEEAFVSAKAAGLDFFAITEHNHIEADGKGERKDGRTIAGQPDLYAGQPFSLVETANRLDQPGQFVTLYGQEWSTISTGNHINIFGVGEVVNVQNGDVPALLTWAQAHPDSSGRIPLLQFNHPRNPDSNPLDYGHNDYAADQWVAAVDPFVELIEVLNAPALKDGTGFRTDRKEGYYFQYLNLGFHVGPSVGHDNHWKNWGTFTDARIAVIAASLTRESLMEAMRARHVYATEDKNLKVIFRSNESLGGDVVNALPDGTSLPLSVEIQDGDPDESDARYRVDVFSDSPGGDRASRPVESYSIEGNTNGRFPLEGIEAKGPGQFVLLRITQTSAEEGDEEHEEIEDRVWTAPIWFEAGVAPAIAATFAVRIIELVPNPVGEDFQGEAIMLQNNGASPVDVQGWQLRDLAGNVWNISGMMQPGQKMVFTRAGQQMSLNNDGDVIDLVGPAGVVVDTIHYGRASEGQRVAPIR